MRRSPGGAFPIRVSAHPATIPTRVSSSPQRLSPTLTHPPNFYQYTSLLLLYKHVPILPAVSAAEDHSEVCSGRTLNPTFPTLCVPQKSFRNSMHASHVSKCLTVKWNTFRLGPTT